MTDLVLVGASRIRTGASRPVSGKWRPDTISHSRLVHRAMVMRGERVAFVGSEDEARAFAGPDAEVVDLDGAVVTPAFVDAHVHATGTGLLLHGLDLTGCTSLAQCLDAVRAFAASSDAPVLWGHGWDQTHWPERRPPTRRELDDAVGGRPAYLSRVDVHSALVSTPIAVLAEGETGYHPEGPLSQQAHHVARGAAKQAVTPTQREAAQRAFLAHAAAHGVGTVHECGGPDLSSDDDLGGLLRLSIETGLDVVGYWGELVPDATAAREVLDTTGAHGLAGDLFCDGALGSRTAALHQPYSDAPDNHGARYLAPSEIAAHVIACTQVGVQAGFHVIGDAAVEAIVEGFARAGSVVGVEALAQRRHRLEHLEMIDAGQAAALARWGVVASVQPLFDALWGGTSGMYAARLGAERALPMNPFATLAAQGMVLAFGSDTPVTPIDPWAAVRAAVHHHTPGSGIPLEDAFAAHTTSGHHAAGPVPAASGRMPHLDASETRHTRAYGDGEAGTLEPGAVASFAVWDGDGFEGATSPNCLRTVVRGRTIFTV